MAVLQLTLAEFLARAASEPFRYGEWDCAMALANWVREQTGTDPAPGLRGRYADEATWRGIVERAGGLCPLVSRLALSAGLSERKGEPQPGDIAVVGVPMLGEAGAIWSGERWIAKLERGVFSSLFWTPLAVWGL